MQVVIITYNYIGVKVRTSYKGNKAYHKHQLSVNMLARTTGDSLAFFFFFALITKKGSLGYKLCV